MMIPKLVLICVLLVISVNARAKPSVDSNLVNSNINDENSNKGSIKTKETFSSEQSTAFPTSNEVKSPQTHEGSVAAGDEHGHGEITRYPVTTVDFNINIETPFLIGVWILFASIAKIVFHMTPKVHKVLPESSLLIVVGVIVGLILYTSTKIHVSPLTPTTFFFYMLPPIILDAGYFMPNRLFFDNLGTILLMAVVGTLWNMSTIGGSLYFCGMAGAFGDIETPVLDTFLFSSLISAVDPVAVLAVFEEIHVNEVLYIVVFGESLLNDAVTVVLYHMFEKYSEMGMENIIVTDVVNGILSFFCVALGGVAIGVIWGFLTGLVTRFTDHVRVIEPIFVFVMAYLAYLNAEIFHWSGILAITFCGITMKNYVEANVSHKSHTTIKYALKMLSSSSETIIFMFLGVATVNNHHEWNTWFIVLTIVFCCVFRVLGVIILVALVNRFRIVKLSKVDQFVMSYGGLRGAVAFALVLLIDKKHIKLQPLFVTTTICVIYFTVFLQGITIKPLVKILNVKRAEKRKPTMNERIHERFIDHMMAGLEDIVGKTGNYNIRDKFKRIDNRFIRPYLIRDHKGAEPKIIETYSKLTMKDAMELMRRNPSTVGQMSNTESMNALFRNFSNVIGGSPSFSNMENLQRNLDIQELQYNPSKKDLTDARIHHLLAEELKPYRRSYYSRFSRHTVDDRDLSTQVNYKMRMHIRRMAQGDRKHHKRGKKMNKENSKQNHVSFPDFQQNGSTKHFVNEDYINEVLNENNDEDLKRNQNDDWEGGLTFIAKSTDQNDGNKSNDSRFITVDVEGDTNSATPTTTESTLPWKRDECDGDDVIQQTEFPSWANNKEYLAYNSPSATFLGGITRQKQKNSVIGLFRRESQSGGSAGGIDSDSSSHRREREKRSASLAGTLFEGQGHSSQFPVTASHRRNTRKGSLLEVSGESIPEIEETSSYLPQRGGQDIFKSSTSRPRNLRTFSLNQPSTSDSSDESDKERGKLMKKKSHHRKPFGGTDDEDDGIQFK